MTTAETHAPVPVPDVDSAGYWEGARAGRLMLCRADQTGEWIHPPQELSSSGGPTHFEEVSGRGTIFSFIVVRQATVPGHQEPYVVGVIELDEQSGLRLAGIINADPEIVEIGAAVRARLAEIGSSGFRAPEFDVIPD